MWATARSGARCSRTCTRRSAASAWSPTARSVTSRDRKSTHLNSSHMSISYAVFCLKKKNSVPVGVCVGVKDGDVVGVGVTDGDGVPDGDVDGDGEPDGDGGWPHGDDDGLGATRGGWTVELVFPGAEMREIRG